MPSHYFLQALFPFPLNFHMAKTAIRIKKNSGMKKSADAEGIEEE
jgi:hypothetical protein